MSGFVQDSKLWTWKLNLGWGKSHGGLTRQENPMAVCTTVTYTSTVNSNILYKMKYWWEFYLAESCNWWIKYMSHLMRANLPYLVIKHVQVDG